MFVRRRFHMRRHDSPVARSPPVCVYVRDALCVFSYSQSNRVRQQQWICGSAMSASSARGRVSPSVCVVRIVAVRERASFLLLWVVCVLYITAFTLYLCIAWFKFYLRAPESSFSSFRCLWFFLNFLFSSYFYSILHFQFENRDSGEALLSKGERERDSDSFNVYGFMPSGIRDVHNNDVAMERYLYVSSRARIKLTVCECEYVDWWNANAK